MSKYNYRHKICLKCGEHKPHRQYHKNRASPDGLSSSCKTCVKLYEELRMKDPNYKARKYLRLYERMDQKKRLRGFDLTIAFLLEQIFCKPCIYCNDTHSIGCDRKDNEKAHTQANVVPCCTTCNITRGDRFTFDEFLAIGAVIRQLREGRAA